MEKTWYIKIKGKQQGPYTVEQLKLHREVTPDTLVWYPIQAKWVPLREIPELQEIFKDPKDPSEEIDPFDENSNKPTSSDALVLEMQTDPPQFTWIFLVLALILLILLQFFKSL